jgi:trk system potassium uptake protein TrkA
VKIVIMGAGEIGRHLAYEFSTKTRDITVIDRSEEVLNDLGESLDINVHRSDGASVTTLAEIGMTDTDLFLAATQDDPANMVACSVAKALGAKFTLCRVSTDIQREEWLFDYRQHFHIDQLFSTERLASLELAKYVRNPEGIFVEEIARGRIEIQQIRIEENSPLANRRIADLKLPERIRLAFILREGDVIVPGGQDELRVDDTVTLFGRSQNVEEFVSSLKLAPISQRKSKVVIFGGSEYSISLAQTLEGGNYEVRILEADRNRCDQLAELFRKTIILNADGTSLQHLIEEQVGMADFFIASSDEDEDNVIACLEAKSLGTRYCLALIRRADYASVIERNKKNIGILAAVSPRVVTARELLRFVPTETYHTVLNLPGKARVIQLPIRENGPSTGKKLSEINWPKNAGIVAVIRNQDAFVPVGHDTIEAGDSVYVATSQKATSDVLKILL